MQNFLVVCAVLAGGLLNSLMAQVVTVGGLNPDYVDLQSAVALAAPGSVVLVRPGMYTGFSTNKPLRIFLQFGASGGSIRPAAGAAYAITLSGMAADGTFVLVADGAKVLPGTLGAIRIANTAGRVFVEGLTIAAGTAAAAIDVQNAGPVLLHDCQLAGTPGLLLQTATVVANDVRVSSPAGSAVAALNCTLDFAGGSFDGFDLPALYLVYCGIRLAGDGGTRIRVANTSQLPLPAIEAVNCLVQWDPSHFVLAPANGAVPLSIGGNSSVVTVDPPIVTVHGGPLGGTGSIRCTSNTPQPGMVAVAPFAPPLFLGFAGLYIDLTQSYAVPLLGIVDATGLALTFLMPTTPSLLGDVACVQGAVFDGNGLPTLSGPVPLVTR